MSSISKAKNWYTSVVIRFVSYVVNNWFRGVVILSLVAFFVITTLGVLGELPASLQLAMAGGPNKEVIPQVIDYATVQSLNIPRIGLEQRVIESPSIDEEIFNELLLQGVVQYPGTGRIGEKKPIILLGHSTRKNTPASQYYRYLNGLDTVRLGDTIELSGGAKTAVYEVISAGTYKNYEVDINLGMETDNLIITTCSRIGAKEDRVVVEARLVRIINK